MSKIHVCSRLFYKKGLYVLLGCSPFLMVSPLKILMSRLRWSFQIEYVASVIEIYQKKNSIVSLHAYRVCDNFSLPSDMLRSDSHGSAKLTSDSVKTWTPQRPSLALPAGGIILAAAVASLLLLPSHAGQWLGDTVTRDMFCLSFWVTVTDSECQSIH